MDFIVVKSIYGKILQIKVLESKTVSQRTKKRQNPTLHNHGVKWSISKSNKIRDQGMENIFLCYVCEYVPLGYYLK